MDKRKVCRFSESIMKITISNGKMNMKKFLKTTLAIILITGAEIIAYNIQKAETLSELAVENIEALASGEGNGTPCGGPKNSVTGNCESRNTVNCKDLSGCQ